jgi:hypothetical protein
MQARAFKFERLWSTFGRLMAGLLPCAALLGAASSAEAQVVPGNTGAIRVLADGLVTPTTVAVRDGVAFVPEGQFARLGVKGGLFRARAISVDNGGILADKALRILLPGNDFFPEGVAVDDATGDIFVGSIFNGIIEKFPAALVGTREQFAPRAPNLLTRGALGLKVDNARNLLWACDSSLAIPGGTVTGIDLTSRQVVVTHELPDGSLCNDIFIDAAGNLLVTETLVGQVFLIDAANALTPNSAQLFLATPGIAPPAAGQLGANGLTVAGGALFVSNTFAGTLVRFDLNVADAAATAASEQIVVLSEGGIANAVLSGPDGIQALSETQLLVVENGFAGLNLNRVVEVTLDAQ